VLTAIPAAAFILPDLFGGHLLLTGDNLQQNYPLHVLVGSMLRHGQLPFWNQYIFSGSPLLADFNAGAFYPVTVLFVLLPDRAAWIATEVVLFAAIAIGMYAFLRALKLSTMACFLAAATFAFSGTVLSQVNHVDMTEGFVAIPWMLLAVHHIVRDGHWRWSILLGAAYATVIFGGAPEAMLDEALLVLAYAAVSAGLDRGRWWRAATRCAAGVVLAVSLAAIQLLPGLSAVANSQRSAFGASFASTDGFPPKLGVLSLVPYIFGGYHHLGEAGYFSFHNLPEEGIYLGILPLIALVTLLAPRWPSRLPGRERLTWYVVGLLGLLLAFGASTPLEHAFNAIPLYGHQRLQSRNMIDVSVALCVLFAGWLDRPEEERDRLVRYERLVAAVPLGVVIGLATWAVVAPSSLLWELGHVHGSAAEIHTAREATFIALGFCAVAAVVVWLRHRLPARWWFGAVTVFVAVDVGLMAWTSQLATFPSNAILGAHTPIEQFVAAHLAPGGRFDVFDPQGWGSSNENATGLPDLNVLAHLPSVAGYASIENGNYSVVTDTHKLGDLGITELGTGTLDELDLQEVLTVPQYFLLPMRAMPASLSHVQLLREDRGQDPVLPLRPYGDDPSFDNYPPPRPALATGHSSQWFLGESLRPTSAGLLFVRPATSAVIQFGSTSEGGHTTWGPAVAVADGAATVEGALPATGASAVAVAMRVLSGRIPPFQGALTVAGRPYELDGSLSGALQPSAWHDQGSVEGFALFVRNRTPTPIYAVTGGHGVAPPVRVLSTNTKIETVRVHARVPVTIVRHVAWDPGWEGTVSVNGGKPQKVAVTLRGLVQQVEVPAGDDVVTFRYRPPHLEAAVLLSLGAVLALLGLAVVMLVRRRRRVG
jgi:hypothetical protein